jgi:multiple sugar transport system permease protein
MPSKSGRRTSRWLLNLLTFVITDLVIFPIYWMFLTSVSDERAMYSANPPLLPLQPQLDAFVDLLQTSGISGWIVNTVFVASCTAAVVLVISVHGGYSLSRFRFHGATFFPCLH